MSMPPAQGAYTCPYCRMASEGTGGACPHCGAPVDVRRRVTDSGWVEQPPIRDMARIRFNRSTCQISGTYVPVAEMGLHDNDWVYFSHHVLLHTDPQVRLGNLPMRGGWKRMRAGMPLIMLIKWFSLRMAKPSTSRTTSLARRPAVAPGVSA